MMVTDLQVPRPARWHEVILALPLLTINFVLTIIILPCLGIHQQMLMAKGGTKRSISITAMGVAFGRHLWHRIGLIYDPVSVYFVPLIQRIATVVALPWVQVFGKLSEGYGGLAYVGARTKYFDQVIMKNVTSNPDLHSVVILGAGFDTRFYRLNFLDRLQLFEVDIEPTQMAKVTHLCEAGVDVSHVTFVPVDFAKENFLEKLEHHGFDASQPALFVWESVCMYVPKEGVLETLQTIRQRTHPSTVLAMDFFDECIYRTAKENKHMYGFEKARAYATKKGEPFLFGVTDRVKFFKDLGFKVVNHLDSRGLETKFLSTIDGRHTCSKVIDGIHVVELQHHQQTIKK